MRCSRCQYDFCWICLGHYKNYTHTSEQNRDCWIQANTRMVFWCFLFFMVYYRLILSLDIVERGMEFLVIFSAIILTSFVTIGLGFIWYISKYDTMEYIRVAVMGPLATMLWVYLSTKALYFNFCLQMQLFVVAAALVCMLPAATIILTQFLWVLLEKFQKQP